MTSVVEESFAPRLVVDNTEGDRDLAREQEGEGHPYSFVSDYSAGQTIIEKASLFRALTGEEGFHVQ